MSDAETTGYLFVKINSFSMPYVRKTVVTVRLGMAAL